MFAFDDLADSYRTQFGICVPQPADAGTIEAGVIAARQDLYESVASRFSNGLPWWAIGLIHAMEASLDLTCHLHNGDSLKRRTVNEPAGRPVAGSPPFTWEASAEDALRYDQWDKVPASHWCDVAGVLWQLEAYNGWGTRKHGIRTPYLWSKSNLEQPGKYVRDGVWDPNAVSQQVGAAVILKQLLASGAVAIRAALATPLA